jgi:hypothetical protein
MRGEGAGSCRRVQSLDWVSLNQSYHPAPLYSVKGMHDVVPVEYGQETFYRSGSVARPGLNVFPKDAPGVLDGAQDSLLVWIIHDVRNSLNRTDSRLKRNFRSSLALRFNASEAIAISRALCPQAALDSLSPARLGPAPPGMDGAGPPLGSSIPRQLPAAQ